jgi:hypothetical protein
MKNKCNETGTEYRNALAMAQIPERIFLGSNEPYEHRSGWADPAASRTLIIQLLDSVNSQAEYEQLISDRAELDRIIAASSKPMKGGLQDNMAKEKSVTIQGVPVIDIYESFDGSYWFITEKLYKQDSIIHGKVCKDDQILFGYVKLSACPGFAEWGNISESELKSLGNRVWKVHRQDWEVCPEVEVQ